MKLYTKYIYNMDSFLLFEEDIKNRNSSSKNNSVVKKIHDIKNVYEGIYEFQGIRITPSKLIFRDVLEADILRLKFTLHNISDKPKTVRILEPRSLGFKLRKVSRGKMLSPGMLLEKSVKFFNMRNMGYLLTSAIPICVGEKIWDLPIVVETAMAQFEIEPPEIDFGTVDVGTTPTTKTFKILNSGPVPSKFAFDLGNNDLDLTVQPMKGELMGKTSIEVRVQIVPIHPGDQFTEFWLRGYRRPIRIPVMVTANVPHLEIYHPNKTWNFTLIDFPPTYFGTCCNETLALRNVSANVSYYVILGEVNNKPCVLEEAARGSPAFNVFRMVPDEGSLKAFEGRICSVEFRPKECYMKNQPWKHMQNVTKEVDFLVFVVMLRVQSLTGAQLEKAIENHMKCVNPPHTVVQDGENGESEECLNPEESSSSDISQAESGSNTVPKMQMKIVIPTIRLCLHGIAIIPQVELLPTEFSLNNMTAGIAEQRVLKITNQNNILPINFSYKKTLSVDMLPPSGKIKPLQSLEVSVSFRTQVVGTIKKLVKIEILGKSEPFADKPHLLRIGHKGFLVTLVTISKISMPKPKFNMGITPQITNEVGILTNQVTFDSEIQKPQVAMLKADLSRKRTWFPHEKTEKAFRKITKKMKNVSSQLEFSSKTKIQEIVISEESLCVKSTDYENGEDPDKSEVATLELSVTAVQTIKGFGDVVMEEENETQESVQSEKSDDLSDRKAPSESTKSSDEREVLNIVSKIKEEAINEKTIKKFNNKVTRLNKESRKDINYVEAIAKLSLPVVFSSDEVVPDFKSSKESIRRSFSIPLTVDKLPSLLTLSTEVDQKSQNTPGRTGSNDSRKTMSESILRSHFGSFQDDSIEDLSVGRLGLPQKFYSIPSKKDSLTSDIISEETDDSQNKNNISHVVDKTPLYSDKTTTNQQNDSSSSIENRNSCPGSGGSRKQLSFLVDLHAGEIISPGNSKKTCVGTKRVDGRKSSMTEQSRKSFTLKPIFKGKDQHDGSDDSSISKNPSLIMDRSESMAKIDKTSKMFKVQSSMKEVKLPPKEAKKDILQSDTKVAILKDDHNVAKPVSQKSTVKKSNELEKSNVIQIPQTIEESSSNTAQATAELMMDNILKKTAAILDMEIGRSDIRATSFSIDTKTIILHDNKDHIDFHSATDIVNNKTKLIKASSPSTLSTTSLRRRSNASNTKSISFARKWFINDYVDEALEAAKLLLDNEENKKLLPEISQNEPEVLNKDLIAFPNDMQRSLRQWPPEKKIRSIFTGKTRYSCPVDTEYTRSTKELADRIKNHFKYIKTMRQIAQHLKQMEAKKTGKSLPPVEEVRSCKLDLERLLKLPKALPMMTVNQIKNVKFEESSLPLYPLTALQLYNIRVKPRSINFGKIAPKSNIFENLTVENLNPFKIMFVILPGDSGIKFPDGNRKTVQPMSKLKFKMAYYELTMGRHNGSMQYVINENHSFEVTVYAEVIPKTLQLDPNMLDFKNFSHDAMFQPIYLTVGIVNNLQCYTKFFWEVPLRSCYSIYPISGSVPPLSTLQVCVKNIRDVVKPLTLDIIMTTESGSKEKLHCTSHIRDGKYVGFLNKKLDLQELSLNLPTEHFAVAYNGSYCTYMFKILNPEPMPGITVTPQTGLLKPRSAVTFLIHCQIKGVVKFEVKLQLQLERTRIIELPIVGSVGYPNVILKPDQIKLRRMSADSYDSVRMTIKNRGSTVAKVKFLLHNHTEYFISKSPDIYATKDSDKEEYKLETGKSVILYLHFVPHDVATYNFAFPVIINDILGPVELENPETFSTHFYLNPKEDWFKGSIYPQKIPPRLSVVTVKCTVANHVLSISKSRVYLYYPSNPYQENKTSDTIRVTNMLGHQITFQIDTHALKEAECPFRFVTTDKGTVTDELLIYTFEQFEFENFHIYFRPKKPGTYVLKLPIIINGYEGLYNNLYFEGTYREPVLEVNAKEIYFQPLPLGLESVSTINITASNYWCKSKIIANIMPGLFDEKIVAEKLSMMFLSGYKIHPSETPLVFPVRLIFRSQEPVSFKTRICFSDTLGHNCYVKLVATTDNCSLTTYAFLAQTDAAHITVADSQTSNASSIEGNLSITSSRPGSRMRSLSATTDDSETQDSKSFRIQSQVQRKPSKRSGPIEFSSMTLTGDSSISSAIGTEMPVVGEVDEEETDKDFGCHYPRFPSEEDESERAQFLNKTLEAVEYWLYDEGFHCSFAPTIPEGMSMIVSLAPPSGKPSLTKQFVPKTILDLLDNLMGTQMRKLIVKGPLPENNEERIVYFHTMYYHLIQFLTNHGGCLAHVKPCYLLSYNDYVTFITRDVVDPKNPSRKLVPCESCIDMFGPKSSDNASRSLHFDKSSLKIISYKDFISYSKQCWLDLILQLHKTMVLSKIAMDSIRFKKPNSPSIYVNLEVGNSELQLNENRSSIKDNEPLSDNQRKIITETVQENPKRNVPDEALGTNIYNQQESIILLWLEENYKHQRLSLWESSSQTILTNRNKGLPPFKEVTNFESDLSDGLVFAAVTAAYCPYLATTFFNDLFPNPLSEEESFHNAIQVTKAWQSIKLGFTIFPEDIVDPNPVRMLLLSAYLYEILPSFTPKSIINFKTELSKEEKKTLTLANPSEKKVTYGVIILGDPLGLFKIKNESMITVQNNSSAILTVAYNARMIGSFRATLILCGNISPPNFGRNLAFELVAEASTLTVSETFVLSPPLYKPLEEQLEVTPPYKQEAEYDIYITEDEPTTEEKLKIMLWRDILALKRYRRLFILEDKIYKQEYVNTVPINLKIYCLIPQTQNYWLIFRNSNVGDFIVKITIHPKEAPVLNKLKLTIPKWDCKCIDIDPNYFEYTIGCPMRLEVAILCRNVLLWNAIYHMMDTIFDEQEKKFWHNYRETNIGLRLSRYLCENDPSTQFEELAGTYNKAVTYVIHCNKNDLIVVPAKFHIPDVRDFQSISFPIHLLPELNSDTSVKLTLRSEDNTEVRIFDISFLKPVEPKPPKKMIRSTFFKPKARQ